MNRRSWLAINAWLASDLGLGFLSSAGDIFPNAPSNIMLTDPRPKAFIALSPFSSNGELETMRSNLRGILRPMRCKQRRNPSTTSGRI